MKLDDTGAAFFVEDVDDNEEEEESFLLSELTSPLPNRIGHYFENAPEKEDRREKEEEREQITLEEDVETKRNVRKKRKKRRELRLTRSGSHIGDDMFDMDDLNDADTEDDTTDINIKSISELIDETTAISASNLEEPARVSFSSGYYSEPEITEGRLVNTSDARSETIAKMSQSMDHDIFNLEASSAQIGFGQTCSEPSLDNMIENCNEDLGVWRWGELPKQEDTARGEGVNKSWFSWSNKSQPKEETVGVYLDEIADDPNLMATYIGKFKTEEALKEADPLSLYERVDSGYDDKMDQKTPQNNPEPRYDLDVAVSVCGRGKSPQKEEPITPELFLSGELSHQEFVQNIRENPNFLSEKDLLIRLNEKYVSWEIAGPILMRKPHSKNSMRILNRFCTRHFFPYLLIDF